MAKAIEKSPEKEEKSLKPRSHASLRNVPNILILKMIKAGKTYREIGDIYNVTPQAIYKKYKQIGSLADKKAADTWEEEKGIYLSNAERVLAEAMVERKCIRKANLANRASAYKVCFDANRLVRGHGGGDNSLIPLDLSGYRSVQLNVQVNAATGQAGSEARTEARSEAGGGPAQGEGGDGIGKDQT